MAEKQNKELKKVVSDYYDNLFKEVDLIIKERKARLGR